MKFLAKALLGAAMLAGASVAFAAPASATVDVGVSFGLDGPGYGFDPCDYYDYYDEPPPWGLPDDYCDYPVYFEPVFFDGYWYRGPIYYRWTHGRRVFWLNGSWREDGWRGPRPGRIAWNNRGTHVRGFRPGIGFHGGGRDWHGGAGNRHWHDNNGDRPWPGHGGNDRPHDGGGDRGGDHPHDGGGTHWGGGDRGDRGGFGDRGGGVSHGDHGGNFGGNQGGGHGNFGGPHH